MKAGNPRLVIPILAAVAFAAILGLFGYRRAQQPTPERTADAARSEVVSAMPGANPPLPPTNAEAGPSAAAGVAPVPPAGARPALGRPDAISPSFDIVRVEPTGESVIAGRAAPGATIDLMRNGESFARAIADPSGLFAIVPPPLPAGSHEIVLQAIAPDGARAQSGQSVTVVIAEGGASRPLVAVTAPDQPTVVLSRPDEPASDGRAAVASASKVGSPINAPGAAVGAAGAPAGTAPAAAARAAVSPQAAPDQAAPGTRRNEPAAKPPQGASAALSPAPLPQPAKRAEVFIAAVEAEGSGRLFVSGLAAPGATLRLYLNDAFVAPGGTDGDGRLSFSIEKGVQPGDYRVRLDDVDPVSGTVKSRAEVRFNVPVQTAAATPPVGAVSPPAGAVSPPAGAVSPPASVVSPPVRSDARPAVGDAPLPQAAQAPQPTLPPATPRPAVASIQDAPTAASRQTDPGQVLVPEINTAIVARGDNLWRISKRIYGQGTRYTVIFGANQPQIRDAKMIFPGQVFVLPPGADSAVR
jgi:nucleoid-associated protein YgaU